MLLEALEVDDEQEAVKGGRCERGRRGLSKWLR